MEAYIHNHSALWSIHVFLKRHEKAKKEKERKKESKRKTKEEITLIQIPYVNEAELLGRTVDFSSFPYLGSIGSCINGCNVHACLEPWVNRGIQNAKRKSSSGGDDRRTAAEIND